MSSHRSACSTISGPSSSQPCCWVKGCQRNWRSASASVMGGNYAVAWTEGSRFCRVDSRQATVDCRLSTGGEMRFRKYELGTYDEMRRQHSWDVPPRYNIAQDVCDKHEPDRL